MATATHHPSRRGLLASAAIAASLLLVMLLGVAALPARAQSTTSGATITVNTDRGYGVNDGHCSLSEAVKAANSNQATDTCQAGSATGEDTIVFELGTEPSIELQLGELGITDGAGLVIDGGAKTRTTVGRLPYTNEARVFRVDQGARLTLRNLGVAHGDTAATGYGGGIYNLGTLEVSGSTFFGNTATRGGGIYNAGTLKVANSTFHNNSADRFGGGIYNAGTLGDRYNAGTLTATNSTFANNSAGAAGGGVYNAGEGNTATLRNTILANNPSGGNCYGTIADGGYNIEDANACGFDQASSSRSGTDPKLDPQGLRYNGGPTRTIALLQDSPAKDAIPEGTNGCGTDITTDQRGVQRPQWSACDAGAFEIEKPNDPPVANDDEEATDEDTATDIDVLTNDSDPEDDALGVQSFTEPSHGRVTKNPDGTLRYEPDKDFDGEDSFTYTVSDGKGGAATATVAVTITPINDAPVISSVANSGPVGEGSPATITATATDVEDVLGDTLAYEFDCDNDSTFEISPQPMNDAQCTFEDDGTRRVNVRVSDSDSGTTTGFTNVTVNNVAPDAANDSASAQEGGSDIVIDVLANDTDVSGDTLIITGNTQPPAGEGSANCSTSTCTLTPDADFNGNTSFTYTISDGDGGTDTAAVTIAVAPVNDAPTVAVAAGGQCDASGTAGTINLTVGDVESAASALTLTATSSNQRLVPSSSISSGGSGAGRTLTLSAQPKRSGAATVTLTVSDGDKTSTIPITVKAGTDAKETLTGTSGADIIFGKNGNDTINAQDGNDLVCGGNGSGTMSGGEGDDTLDGANGNDVLRGDEGEDILRGGSGEDTLTGGADADSFSGGSGTDAATDFDAGEGDTQDGTIP